MGLTITEKILLAHTNKRTISAGEFIDARVDLALANDITAPLAIKRFRASRVKKVFDRNPKRNFCLDIMVVTNNLKQQQNCGKLQDL